MRLWLFLNFRGEKNQFVVLSIHQVSPQHNGVDGVVNDDNPCGRIPDTRLPLWPTYPAQLRAYPGWWHQWRFVDKPYTLEWSKIVMLVLLQSKFSRFSFLRLFFVLNGSTRSLLVEQWKRKREQKASFDVWTEQRVTYVGEQQTALSVQPSTTANHQAGPAKAKPDHHCFCHSYHYMLMVIP